MKTGYNFFITVLIFFIYTNLFAFKAEFIVGNVTIERNKQILTVVKDTVFQDGDIVTTADKSYLVILTENNDQITVKEKSRLLIDNKTVSLGSISIVKGTLNAKFNKIKSEDSAKVYTPTSVCAVRGTEFSVTVSDSGESLVKMSEGKLDVYNPSGSTTIAGNENTEALPGNKPIKSNASIDPDNWKTQHNDNFKDNLSAPVSGYEKQLKILNERSEHTDKEINNINILIPGIKNKNQLAKTEEKIISSQSKAADDYMLNKSSTEAINQIVLGISTDKKDIIDNYNSLKSEMNKVLELQQKNLEEINKVREAYKKAKEEILNKYKNDVEEIKRKVKESQY